MIELLIVRHDGTKRLAFSGTTWDNTVLHVGVARISRTKKPRFFKKKVLGFYVCRFLGFLVLMYKDRIQNYDQEIHDKYHIHDTPFLVLHHAYPCALQTIVYL